MRNYLDTETCGLVGMPVLLQYALDDGPISLYEPWKWPVRDTLELIERIAACTVVGFNLAFDWFQLCKLYTTWKLLPLNWIPEHHINEIAAFESRAMDGDCLKPFGALDLMLHARKGPYQSMMNREPIRIRRVPEAAADQLLARLEESLAFEPIYFARSKKPGARWKKFPSYKPGFVDIVCSFHPSSKLKHLAEHALGVTDAVMFADIELDKKYRPVEFGYAPTANATSSLEQNWEVYKNNKVGDRVLKGYAWPGVIAKHIEHWHCCQAAREYARMDVDYTRRLAHHFAGLEGLKELPANDDDSVLACMVGAIRWRGYTIDAPAIEILKGKAAAIVATSPVNVNRVKEVRAYLEAVMVPAEQLAFSKKSTAKDTLEEMEKATEADWQITEVESCELCNGCDWPDRPRDKCPRCSGSGFIYPGKHPVSKRAAELNKIRKAKKEVEFYDKILLAGRLHADFVVIGARSSRMAGAGGVNAMAIKNAPEVRHSFPLAHDGYQLCGGDFDGFEVTIMDAVYQDPSLHAELLSGKSLHSLFGEVAYGLTYDQIELDKPLRKRSKIGVFLDGYGGESRLLAKKLGLSIEKTKIIQSAWQERFPGIKAAREKVREEFSSIHRSESGSFYWTEPSDRSLTLLGFPRFFSMENDTARALFKLANEFARLASGATGPMVERSELRGLQSPAGATCSALLGAALSLVKSIIRAAGNHRIQGTGAGICKSLQRRIWDRQPCGYHPFRVMPMNIHDELMVPVLPEEIEPVAMIVAETVREYRAHVPLLGISWYRNVPRWSDKESGGCATGKLVL